MKCWRCVKSNFHHIHDTTRIFFRGVSPLDCAIRAADRGKRDQLIRYYASEYLRVRRESAQVFTVDPLDAVCATGDGEKGISVKMTFAGDTDLDAIMRSLPSRTRIDQRQRIEHLRLLAECGLAISRKGVQSFGAAASVSAAGVSQLPALPQNPAEADRPKPPGGPRSRWGTSISLDADGQGVETDDAFDRSVAIA